MKSISRTSAMVTTIILSGATACYAMSDQEYQSAIDAINAKYQPTYDEAQKEGDDIEDESGTCIAELGFDADWEETKVSFDVPEVSFNDKDFSFDTLKTTFKNKTIAKITSVETTFKVKDIGFGVKTKVPEVKTTTKEVKTQIPEFKWETTGFSIKIPEFSTNRIEWKFHILKLKELEELNVPCKEEQDRSNKLNRDVDTAAQAHESEIKATTARYLGAKADELAEQIVTAEAGFNEGLTSMDAAIAEMVSNGVDPDVFQTEFDGQSMTMKQAKERLALERDRVLADLRNSHGEIIQQIELLKS